MTFELYTDVILTRDIADLMARHGMPDQLLMLPKISQETLAEMVGTTRSRVNFFMNTFRDLGFIEYNGGLKISGSLITVVLHD